MTPTNLKSWRKSLGLTQAGAAAALNTPLPTYRDWEQGKSKMNGAAVKLAALLVKHQSIELRRAK